MFVSPPPQSLESLQITLKAPPASFKLSEFFNCGLDLFKSVETLIIWDFRCSPFAKLYIDIELDGIEKLNEIPIFVSEILPNEEHTTEKEIEHD